MSITQRGRDQSRAQTEGRINANLEIQTRRELSVHRSASRSRPSSPAAESVLPQTTSSEILVGSNNSQVSQTASITNSQAITNPIIQTEPTVKMVMDKSKLPHNYGRNALVFDGDEPEGLEKYLSTLEDIFETVQATADEEKKDIAIRYCVTGTAREWSAFATFQPGSTWEEFKEEVILNYPECRESKEGSFALLDRLVKKTKRNKIGFDDQGEFMSFTRKFRAEVEKLLHPHSRISNRDITTRFLECCEGSLVVAIRNKLRNMAPESLPSAKALAAAKTAEAAQKATVSQRRLLDAMKNWTSNRDDKFYWTDVLALAAELVEEESVSFYSTGPNIELAVKKTAGKAVLIQEKGKDPELNEMIEAAIAAGLDKLGAAHHKDMVDVQTKIDELSRGKAASQEPAPRRWGEPEKPAYNRQSGNSSRDCFYCGKFGHFIAECQTRHSDIDNGVIKVIDGKTFFYDGRPIPREPKNKTQSQKAAEYKARQTMNSNLFTFDFSEAYIQDTEPNTPAYDSRDDEIRTLRAERGQMRVLLQNQSGGVKSTPSGSKRQSTPKEILSNPYKQMQQFVEAHWDNNHKQFVFERDESDAGTDDVEGF